MRTDCRQDRPVPPPLEVWGGVECTINRIGDQYFSQLERSGHCERVDDIRLFADLGIKALRQPVLWEQVMASGSANWSWPDACMDLIDQLHVQPIVGLLHHGSGPRDTSLLDSAFPSKLAAYAGAVARRYPLVRWYTPINEPLTTARFCGLYGIWHPHGRSEIIFGRILLNECRAIVKAMEAIRRVNPDAGLLQTDDLGKSYSTQALGYQADFNNELRWLGWDLICGKVDRQHYLWDWLLDRCRVPERDLMWFAAYPCPPSMLGVNHYVTSERVLDHKLGDYPPSLHGGNGRHRYVDIEASRCLRQPTAGLTHLLEEAWARYGLRIAITETHIDATRDDQLRWLVEVWQSALNARARGVDVRAVTVWALLGSFDWNCLLTQCKGYYELGAFDARGPGRRPTALARLTRELARNSTPPSHPVLSGRGWWKRPDRFLYKPLSLAGYPHAPPFIGSAHASPLLIAGGAGSLGKAFAKVCRNRGLDYWLSLRQEMDIAEPASVERAIREHRPWAVINTAGYVRIDEAESDVAQCYRENTIGPHVLASACAKHGIPLVTFSTDLVFNGGQDAPYRETDPVAPLNVYGRSKAEAEKGVLQRHPLSLIVRTSALFGPWDTRNFISQVVDALSRQQTIKAPDDITITPTYAPDLINATLDLLIDEVSGVWHLTNGDPTTWAELGFRTAKLARRHSGYIQPCSGKELGFAAQRPANSALASNHPSLMPGLQSGLERYFRERHL